MIEASDGFPGDEARLRLHLILMQKNEGKLLSAWIRYHAKIAEYQDILVIDNGSTDPETLEVLASAEQHGIVVDRNFSSKSDFDNKHNIIFKKIHDAQKTGKFDFIFPLDADEFLVATSENGEVFVNYESIASELRNYVSDHAHFKFSGSFYNNPTEIGTYFFYKEPGVFFSREEIKEIDLGYHQASTVSCNPPIETKIAVVHFQYKRLEIAKTYAVEKLKSRIEDFGTDRLRSFTGVGSHMAKYFYYSTEEYGDMFASASKTKLPIFENAIQTIENEFPYDLFFATDRYEVHRHEVENSPFFDQIRQEGMTHHEIFLIHKYTRRRDHVAIYRESALVPLLLQSGIGRVSVIGNNLDKIKRIIESFSLSHFVFANRCCFFHIEMGGVDELGYPTGSQDNQLSRRYSVGSPALLDRNTQIIVVNGRYRVAVLLQCAKTIASSCIYILPNFWSRPNYHAVLPFFDVIDTEDDVVVLRTTSHIDLIRLEKVLETAMHDNR